MHFPKYLSVSQNSARKLCEMANVKATELDGMRFTDLSEMIKALGLSDEGVENIEDAKSLIENAIRQKTTTNSSPGKVRYFNVKISERTNLTSVFNILHERYFVIPILLEAMRG